MRREDATEDFAGARDRRPIAVVEDHLFHVTELLQAMAAEAPELLPHTAVLCLERPGPDTTAAVERWLASWPGLRVAAAVPPAAMAGRVNGTALDPQVLSVQHAYCRALAGMLLPGGLLLQDIQLATLSFVPADRWWESIYLAATVRGMFPSRPPVCRFFSNKRGYEATFGRDLAEAGFDPRDVIEKGDLKQVLVPTLRAFLERRFPWELETAGGQAAVGTTDDDRREAEAALDLVAWLGADGSLDLGGRAVAGDRRLHLRSGSPEGETWKSLIADRLTAGEGLPVVEVGERLAPPGALRAEATNAAARHLHLLRSRLAEPGVIVTARHAYRLREGVRVGVGRLR
jgi:hypothetical protein